MLVSFFHGYYLRKFPKLLSLQNVDTFPCLMDGPWKIYSSPSSTGVLGEYSWRERTWDEFVWGVDLCLWEEGREDTTMSPLRHRWSPWCTMEIPDDMEHDSCDTSSPQACWPSVKQCLTMRWQHAQHFLTQRLMGMCRWRRNNFPWLSLWAHILFMENKLLTWHHAAGQLS